MTVSGQSLIANLNGNSLLNVEASKVKEIVFTGNAGNDRFTNGTAVPSKLYGNDGDDRLDGGSGADFIEGGYGNDLLRGFGGDDVVFGSGDGDTLYGDDGNDTLKGHGGGDTLYGGAGNDSLNGGSSNDVLYGDSGNDLLVTVGLGADTVVGGSQWDNVWMDESDQYTDPTTDERNLGYIHRIAGFRSFRNSTAIGLDALGEALPDPSKQSGDTGSLVPYDSNPLFGAGGPKVTDVNQGAVGTCYYLARLAAFAMKDPDFIKKSVAPLGDGSYAVRFWRDGKEDYVRVDSDLWTANGAPIYANVGAEGAMWVAVMEKAYAAVRTDEATYTSISGGNGVKLSYQFEIGETVGYDGSLTQAQVKTWLDNGRPSGYVGNKIQSDLASYFAWAKAQLADGKPMVSGSFGSLSNTATVTASNFQTASHIYAVKSVETTAGGAPLAITFYNPYGHEVRMTDLGRVYYFTSGGRVVTTPTPEY